MYGSYGYGYSAMANTVGVGLVLGFIAFVAAIVVTVLFYRKFIAVDNIRKVPGLKHDWGPFFRFEHLIIENILKVLYIFVACLIAFESAASIITSLFSIMYDPGASIAGIIAILIVCVVLEVLNRLWFEFALLTVLIWKNTSAIRKSVASNGYDQINSYTQSSQSYGAQGGYAAPSSQGNQPQPPIGGQPFASSQQPTAPVAGTAHNVQSTSTVSASSGAPTAPYQPNQASPVQADHQNISSSAVSTPASSQSGAIPADAPTSHNTAWTCPSCGAFNKSGSFCAQCGTRRN